MKKYGELSLNYPCYPFLSGALYKVVASSESMPIHPNIIYYRYFGTDLFSALNALNNVLCCKIHRPGRLSELILLNAYLQVSFVSLELLSSESDSCSACSMASFSVCEMQETVFDTQGMFKSYLFQAIVFQSNKSLQLVGWSF